MKPHTFRRLGRLGSRTVGWAALLSTPIAAGCLQELDDGAANGAARVPPQPGGHEGGPCPTGFIAGGGDVCLPLALDTPPIQLDDGGSTTDPCSAVAAQSLSIRQTYCAGCHAPPARMGGFDFVLDDARLVTAVSNVLDDAGVPWRFVVPGDPDHSRLYRRVALGEMPPTQSPPLPSIPAPTVSDVSLLRYWISNCLGVTPAAADDGAAANPSTDDEGGPAVDDAQPPGDDSSPGAGSVSSPTIDSGAQGGAPDVAVGTPPGGGGHDAGSSPPLDSGNGGGSFDSGSARGGTDAGVGRQDSGIRPPSDAGGDGSRRFFGDAGRG